MEIDKEWEDPVVATPPGSVTLLALATGALLQQRRAVLIMRYVVDAIGEMHAKREVHGDVKPEKILVSGNETSPTIKLLAGAKTGDSRYCAPERALGMTDARADLYSATAVLFELLTGYPPFVGDDDNALRRLHAYAPIQTLAQRAPKLQFIPELEEIIAKGLAKKREARFTSARDMSEALAAAVNVLDEATAEVKEASTSNRKPNDSLLLLAQDLMPKTPDTNVSQPLVPTDNTGRVVRALPWWMRAVKFVRRIFDKLRSAVLRPKRS